MKEIARVFIPASLFALALSLLISVAVRSPSERPGRFGSDVFTTPREALLREAVAADAHRRQSSLRARG
jgi:hypothetical protein